MPPGLGLAEQPAGLADGTIYRVTINPVANHPGFPAAHHHGEARDPGEPMTGTAQVRLRRVYDQPEPADGRRVLVDRLWPRGLSKDRAALDDWLRAVAPSDDLRRWYAHEPGRFSDFRERYQRELRGAEASAAFARLRELARSGPVTLLTATRDPGQSQAAVLAELLRSAP